MAGKPKAPKPAKPANKSAGKSAPFTFPPKKGAPPKG